MDLHELYREMWPNKNDESCVLVQEPNEEITASYNLPDIETEIHTTAEACAHVLTPSRVMVITMTTTRTDGRNVSKVEISIQTYPLRYLIRVERSYRSVYVRNEWKHEAKIKLVFEPQSGLKPYELAYPSEYDYLPRYREYCLALAKIG